jgi:hypothetical protein
MRYAAYCHHKDRPEQRKQQQDFVRNWPSPSASGDQPKR